LILQYSQGEINNQSFQLGIRVFPTRPGWDLLGAGNVNISVMAWGKAPVLG
jgi:hypothetical protein